jgi:hypothetical protein
MIDNYWERGPSEKAVSIPRVTALVVCFEKCNYSVGCKCFFDFYFYINSCVNIVECGFC